jgi:hypothetical protein
MHLVHSFPIRALPVRAAERMFSVPEKSSLDIYTADRLEWHTNATV